jgi:hypothetical protein
MIESHLGAGMYGMAVFGFVKHQLEMISHFGTSDKT